MTVAAPSHSEFRYLSAYTSKHTASSPLAPEPTSDSGCSTPANKQPCSQSALLQDRERDLEFYKAHFLDQAATTVQGPMIISMRVDQDDSVRILVRTTRGSERIEYPLSALTIPWFRKLFGIPYLSILAQICPAIPIHALEPCQHPELPQELVRMEERQIIRCYKFGIFQLLPGQTQEQEGLANPCVFKESDDEEPFDLGSVGSRQNLRPVPSGNGSKPNAYQVAIAVKDGIRNFVPLKFPAVLRRDDASRDLLLLKRNDSLYEENAQLMALEHSQRNC
ncbi:hypothetical protein EC968_008536 [Mortierella alpina]|nr:hypothetical protein EC968_008536 [Mortierella alpina]